MAKKKAKKEAEKVEEVVEAVVEEKVEEPQEDAQEMAEESENDEFDEESSKFAFPMAPIVRMMKNEMDDDKMIRRRVKEGMNLWLESLCRKIAQKMNESEYTMVEADDFKTAIEPYELIDEVEQERDRIVASLEKIKSDCDTLIMDVDRKFMSP
ncbi:histone-like protein [Candidatus Altiarchaeota archaeon]